jgi:GNAT superfamily N-acetyltransferase
MAKLEFSRRPWMKWDSEMQEKLLGLTLVIELGAWAAGATGMSRYPRENGELVDTWVALEDGEPVGWALRVHTSRDTALKGWGLARRSPPPFSFPQKGEVMTYVHPGRRRQGIGRALLRRIAQDMPNAGGRVAAWDDVAELFYKSAIPQGDQWSIEDFFDD